MAHLDDTGAPAGAARALRQWRADARDLPRDCSWRCESSEEDGGVDGLGLLAGHVRRSRGPGAAHRLGDRRAVGRGVLLRPLLRRRLARRGRHLRGRDRGRGSAARSSACSSTRRRAAPPASTFSSDASPAPDPLPRRRPRPRGEGRELRRACATWATPWNWPRSTAAGGADELVFLDIAATPDEAATMTSVVERVADVLDIPFTVGGGVRSVEDASAHHRVGGRPRLAQLGRPGRPVAHHRDRATATAARRSWWPSTPATASCTLTAGEWPRRRHTVPGPSKRPSAARVRSC